MDIGGNLPAERLIEQIILWGRGQIFTAPHHMRDIHEMVVDDIGKIVGGISVRLQKNLVLDFLIFNGDGAEYGILKSCGDVYKRQALH